MVLVIFIPKAANDAKIITKSENFSDIIAL